MTDVDDKNADTKYNCDFCIAKEWMGQRSGRLCFLYQVDFSEPLTFSSDSKDGKVEGEINSEEDFYNAVDQILSFHKTDRIEIALKRIRMKGVSGVCPKSFPRTETTSLLLRKLNLCLGGDSNNELVHLPYAGTILDQPNLFIEAFYVWSDELTKWLRYTRIRDKRETDRQERRGVGSADNPQSKS